MKDAQENSFQSQQEYFTEYIQRHPDWVFAGMYTDDGVSGLSIRKRDGFNRMVADALDGKIDLLITKSLSRFARNTVDALTTIRSLKAAGVAVYFQKENINTMDSTGEFLITLMSSFAEEESRSISENVTWAVRHRYAQGIYHLPGLLLGYQRSPVGEIQVDEAGARVVRFIYLLALAGKSSTDICRILMDYGILSPGQSQRWEPHTVRSILKNEKYMGDAILQKEITVDFLTKTRKPNEGEAPQYYVENGHPCILGVIITLNKHQHISGPQLLRGFFNHISCHTVKDNRRIILGEEYLLSRNKSAYMFNFRHRDINVSHTAALRQFANIKCIKGFDIFVQGGELLYFLFHLHFLRRVILLRLVCHMGGTDSSIQLSLVLCEFLSSECKYLFLTSIQKDIDVTCSQTLQRIKPLIIQFSDT